MNSTYSIHLKGNKCEQFHRKIWKVLMPPGGGVGGSSSGGSNNGVVSGQPTSAPRSIPTTPSMATTTPFNTPAFSVGAPTAPGPITHEMFSNALQNALAASASRVS